MHSTANNPGIVVLFGSGETSSSGQRVWDWLLSQHGTSPHIAIVETPAGFQPNSSKVAGRVADYLSVSLQNYSPVLDIVPARERGTEYSPDNLDILKPMLTADVLFLGAGSPTYAARQLEGSLAWKILSTGYWLGTSVVFASAAILAVNFFALPVYEIYKAGEDLHWLTGLDFFAQLGLSAMFVPHWNNKEGGDELDTSRCFMGEARWDKLHSKLPSDMPVVGIDEHTALVLNPRNRTAKILGNGEITVIHGENTQVYPSGETVPFRQLGTLESGFPSEPRNPNPEILALIEKAFHNKQPLETPPEDVIRLVEARKDARAREDWATADQLRDKISELGWQLNDTPGGPELIPIEK